eukprot:m.242093 g.242093  ORF g.242093 m.242093 type:complete len:50 (-) comp33788_c4_seq2:3434-3583(-)
MLLTVDDGYDMTQCIVDMYVEEVKEPPISMVVDLYVILTRQNNSNRLIS